MLGNTVYTMAEAIRAVKFYTLCAHELRLDDEPDAKEVVKAGAPFDDPRLSGNVTEKQMARFVLSVRAYHINRGLSWSHR